MGLKQVKFSQTISGMASNTTLPLTANGQISVVDQGNIGITLIGVGTAAFTVKVKASMQNLPVDFNSAVSATNAWSYIATIDLISGSTIAGGTGYTFAAAGVKHIKVNNLMAPITWIALEMSGFATGSLTAYVTSGDNL